MDIATDNWTARPWVGLSGSCPPQAITRVGEFFKHNQSCQVVCKAEGGKYCSGLAPVKYNFNYHELPPTTPADCEGARAA